MLVQLLPIPAPDMVFPLLLILASGMARTPVPNIFCFIMERELLMLSLLNSVGVPARLVTLASPGQRLSGDMMLGVIPAQI